MQRAPLYGIALTVSVFLGLGCSHCCRRQPCPIPGAVIQGPCSPGLVPAPATPYGPAPNVPPPFPVGAQPGPMATPGPGMQPPPFPAGGPQQSNFGPPPDGMWQPAPGAVQLAPPNSPPEQRSESTRLYPPVDVGPVPPTPSQPKVTEERRSPMPSAPDKVEERRSSPPPESGGVPSLPVGIPQFTNAKNKVAVGLRPMLDDGLDWLQSHGYRTVLHLRKPGEDDSADRKQVEKRGMKYLTLEVSPQTLTRQVVDEFNRIVSDTSGYPLFVYDRDGSLTGGLWYLHFRTVEQAADDAARVRASSLGLRDREGSHREMWLAIQNLLSQKAP